MVKCKISLVFILAKKLETKKATVSHIYCCKMREHMTSDKNEEAKAAMMAEFSHYDKRILRLFEYVYECQTYKVLNTF